MLHEHGILPEPATPLERLNERALARSPAQLKGYAREAPGVSGPVRDPRPVAVHVEQGLREMEPCAHLARGSHGESANGSRPCAALSPSSAPASARVSRERARETHVDLDAIIKPGSQVRWEEASG
jgi:hypothetical protein